MEMITNFFKFLFAILFSVTCFYILIYRTKIPVSNDVLWFGICIVAGAVFIGKPEDKQ